MTSWNQLAKNVGEEREIVAGTMASKLHVDKVKARKRDESTLCTSECLKIVRSLPWNTRCPLMCPGEKVEREF